MFKIFQTEEKIHIYQGSPVTSLNVPVEVLRYALGFSLRTANTSVCVSAKSARRTSDISDVSKLKKTSEQKQQSELQPSLQQDYKD